MRDAFSVAILNPLRFGQTDGPTLAKSVI